MKIKSNTGKKKKVTYEYEQDAWAAFISEDVSIWHQSLMTQFCLESCGQTPGSTFGDFNTWAPLYK